jgi:hypothetical protein
MYEQIKQKVKAVSGSFAEIKEKAKYFSENPNKFDLKFCFSEAITKINPGKKSFSVGAVDSGFFSDSFVGFDFCFVKVAGSVFEYKESKLVSSKHFPDTPKSAFITPDSYMQKDEFERFVSISRLKQELGLAKDIIENHKLDYFLLDGSLVPHPQDRIKKDSPNYGLYLELIKAYIGLYNSAEKRGTILVGCIEDSRSNLITKRLGLDIVNDLVLVNYALAKGTALNFFESGSENKVLDDILVIKPINLYSAFLKVNDYDLPLKIELLSPKQGVLDIIYFLSSHTKNYSYPAVIIDADLRAKLSFSEVNTIKNYIESVTDKEGIRKLRRNRRPF